MIRAAQEMRLAWKFAAKDSGDSTTVNIMKTLVSSVKVRINKYMFLQMNKPIKMIII